MVSAAHKRTTEAQRDSKLDNIQVLLTKNDHAASDAFNKLIEHYGRKAPAVKAALIAHAEELGL